MGIGGISIWQLLIILAIIVLLFGTKKLGSLGSDLGSALRGFKNGMKDLDLEKSECDELASTSTLKSDEIPSEQTLSNSVENRV